MYLHSLTILCILAYVPTASGINIAKKKGKKFLRLLTAVECKYFVSLAAGEACFGNQFCFLETGKTFWTQILRRSPFVLNFRFNRVR